MIDQKNNLTCRHCGHRWEYSGNLKLASCPSCHMKVPNPRYRKPVY